MIELPESLTKYLDLFIDISIDQTSSVSIEDLEQILTEDMRFQDPFNDIQGRSLFLKLLHKTAQDVQKPSFEVLYCQSRSEHPREYILKWRFLGEVKFLGQWDVTGLSEIFLSDNGLVQHHIDYWDPTEVFYQRLPLVGSCLRYIRRRVAVR